MGEGLAMGNGLDDLEEHVAGLGVEGRDLGGLGLQLVGVHDCAQEDERFGD